MTIVALDHVNIRVSDVPKTLAFLGDVLGLKLSLSPGATSMEKGAWAMDAQDVPILHVGSTEIAGLGDRSGAPAIGSGAIHHVALRCTAFEETKQRLTDKALPYHENYVPQMKLRQIFVADPNDILFELNFLDAEIDQG